MSDYFVITLGYSAVVKGPFEYDEAVKVAEEQVIRHRHSVKIVKEMGSAAPAPTEVIWRDLK